MEIKTYKCDIDGCRNDADNKGIDMQIIFTTNQTDGANCKPNLYTFKLDMCLTCYGEVLEGNYIYGKGAQGHNQYSISNNTNELKALEHHKDTTVDLWATDRPDLVKDPENTLFKITFNES